MRPPFWERMVLRLREARPKWSTLRGRHAQMLPVRRPAPSYGAAVYDRGFSGWVNLDPVEPGRHSIRWKLEQRPLLEDSSHLLHPFLCGHLRSP